MPQVEDIKSLRLATITFVDARTMLADIEFLDDKTSRSGVPLPVPTMYPGGGVIAVPTEGAVVVVGMRAQQVPLVLAYYPYNVFTPGSVFQQVMNMWGMSESLSPGDVYLRARSDSAKCQVCNVISSIEAIQATADPETTLTYCPNCKTPSATVDSDGVVTAVNTQILGATFHMRADGTIFLQSSNLQSPDQGDASRLFKLAIDGRTGDMTLEGVGDLNVDASGDAYLGCRNLTLNASGAIEENATERRYNTASEVLENSLARVIQAADTLKMLAPMISLAATAAGGTGLISHEADNRTASVKLSDILSAGEISLTTVSDEAAGSSGDRTVLIAGDDDELVLGAKSVSGAKEISVQAATTLTLQGLSPANADGSLSESPGSKVALGTNLSAETTGTMLIQSTGDGEIKSLATMKVTGASVLLNNGSLGVARTTDAIQLNAAFTSFLTSLMTWLTNFQTFYNAHGHAALGSPPSTLYAAAAPSPTTPVAGTITGGSSTVKAG